MGQARFDIRHGGSDRDLSPPMASSVSGRLLAFIPFQGASGECQFRSIATRSSRLVAIDCATPVGIGDHPGSVRGWGWGWFQPVRRAFCRRGRSAACQSGRQAVGFHRVSTGRFCNCSNPNRPSHRSFGPRPSIRRGETWPATPEASSLFARSSALRRSAGTRVVWPLRPTGDLWHRARRRVSYPDRDSRAARTRTARAAAVRHQQVDELVDRPRE